MKKIYLLIVCLLLIASTAVAGDYQYIKAVDLKDKIDKRQHGLLLDIQIEEEFKQHHIPGAIATYAYPVKTDQDKAKLNAIVDRINTGDEPVVIICPRGAGGAKRTYDYLKEQGVAESRLMILVGGQQKWPY